MVNNVVTIFSKIPIEKVFIQRPFQLERPLMGIDTTTSPAVPSTPLEPEETVVYNVEEAPPFAEVSEYAGFSQISAAGKACIPCSNDHFSTVAGELAEAIRFARDGGITHPEVMLRITDAEDQLNALERIDGAPVKVQKLPPEEKELMNEMISASREMRHLLKDIANVEDLESLAALAQNQRRLYRTRLFDLQMARLPANQINLIKGETTKADAQ